MTELDLEKATRIARDNAGMPPMLRQDALERFARHYPSTYLALIARIEELEGDGKDAYTAGQGVWRNQDLPRLERIKGHRAEYGSSLADAVRAVDEEAKRIRAPSFEGQDNAIGAAEAEVGRYIYRRIERLMDAKPGSPESAELDFLANITVHVEEYGEDACADHALSPPQAVDQGEAVGIECHGLDTPQRVCFYEQDFYVLSNFSSFMVWWRGILFPTSEHAYHWAKFTGGSGYEDIDLQRVQARHLIMNALSAHEAFKRAQDLKNLRHTDWDDQKVGIMREIIRAKAEQHEYVRRKLLATGERELVENSWRDGFWGWGSNRDGQNMLGKLWMELRAELRAEALLSLSQPKGQEHGG